LDSTKEAGCFNKFPHRKTTCTIQNHYSIYSILLPLGTNRNPGPFPFIFSQTKDSSSPLHLLLLVQETRSQHHLPSSPLSIKQAARGRASSSLSSFSSSKQLSITILLVNKQQQLQLISLASIHVQSCDGDPDVLYFNEASKAWYHLEEDNPRNVTESTKLNSDVRRGRTELRKFET
ncbi:unnamed protein product, partial [Linum tenue]